jgi:two-component system KDP operon response regulator KdpE
MSRVLVVEDDVQIGRALGINLRARGYEVEIAVTGAQALDRTAHWHPDVVLLDLGLPDMDGVDVVEGVRGWTQIPIIILSARQESRAKVDALDAGADDYVTKPFGMDELLARLRAALRRHTADAEEQAGITTDDGRIAIDFAASTVQVDGEVVRLTPIEWRILSLLAKNPGRLLSQTELLHQVWGPSYEREKNYLRVYLSQLRQKLELDSAHPKHLITESGMGYRFLT